MYGSAVRTRHGSPLLSEHAMKKLLRAIRPVFEVALICAGLLLIPFIPRRLLVVLARRLGHLGFRFARRERRLALANADVVFGASLTASQKEHMVRRAFGSVALTMLDLFWFHWRTRQRVAKWVTLPAAYLPVLQSTPAVYITAHLGNWEVMGLAAALQGFPPASVAATLNNSFADRMITRMRRKTGQRVVPQQGALREIMTILRQGGRVAMLIDQNTMPEDGGVFVDFFGLPAPVTLAAARLARRTGANIVLGYCVAEQLRYTVGVIPVLKVEELQAISDEEATQLMMNAVARVIRDHPDQWVWMYKRWRRIPPALDDDSQFPFYANREQWQKDRQSKQGEP